MTVDNPYTILGLDKNATQEEIDAAFKRAVKQHHPDNGGNEEDFNRVILASLILRDPKKRKKYDTDGVFLNNRPESIRALAIEQIAIFFINSIDAALASNADLAQFNLVAGAQLFFQQRIDESRTRINLSNRKIVNFERVIKRLKSKNSTDIIATMLKNHIFNFKQEIENIKEQIEISNRAKEVLLDYTFEPEKYSGLILPPGFGV
jgi:curved DNA-binding protein CbpA